MAKSQELKAKSQELNLYIELHSRSAFSFLEGSSAPEALMARCAELGMPAMALLDRDGVYGAPRFHMAATKAGLKAHIGAEVSSDFSPQSSNFSPQSSNFSPQKHRGTENSQQIQNSSTRLHLDRKSSRSPNHPITRSPDLPICRLPLLVSSRTGYQNLCRLITKMKLRAAKNEGSVYEQELEEHTNGD